MKWDQNNPEKVKDFIAKMKQDYAFKKGVCSPQGVGVLQPP